MTPCKFTQTEYGVAAYTPETFYGVFATHALAIEYVARYGQ